MFGDEIPLTLFSGGVRGFSNGMSQLIGVLDRDGYGEFVGTGPLGKSDREMKPPGAPLLYLQLNFALRSRKFNHAFVSFHFSESFLWTAAAGFYFCGAAADFSWGVASTGSRRTTLDFNSLPSTDLMTNLLPSMRAEMESPAAKSPILRCLFTGKMAA